MSTRRHFLGWASSTVLLAGLARAQQPARALRIGFLSSGSDDDPVMAENLAALERALRERGYVEGKTLSWQRRWANGHYDRLPALIAELARLKPDLIVVGGGTATDAARKAIRDIPLVMVVSADPVGSGWVPNLARPGGNLTGVTGTAGTTGTKRVEILLELVPRMRRIGVLFNPQNPTFSASNFQGAADDLKREHNVELARYSAGSPTEIDKAFRQMKRDHVEAVSVPPDSLLAVQHKQIADLAIANRLPSSGGLLSYASSGGLVAYGVNYPALYHQAADYVDKIARGAKPGDLAIAKGDIIELWLNQRTAAAIGISIPDSIKLRAHNVIQ